MFGGGKFNGVVASILLLIAILRTQAMDNGLMFYEKCMVLLYLMLQVYEFEKRHNREGKRPNKKICWEVFLEFVALESGSLMIVTLLKSWKMKVEYIKGFKFRLLNFHSMIVQVKAYLRMHWMDVVCCYKLLKDSL